MPVRFVTAEEYLRNPFARVLLRSLGCVSTRPRGAKTTAILIDALRRGESVCIFPSGSLDRGEAHAPARVGVVYIERHAQNAKILPVRISCVSPRVRDILLRKTHCVVHCGAPFRHRVFPSDLQPLADDVMARIRA
jgi:1-acyl-sn-glycerol-3-phosphate acyltransferase